MRKFLVALAIGFCCFAARGQKTRFGDELPHPKPGVVYPIKVHVSGLHYRTEDIGTPQNYDVTYVDAILNGKKVELQTRSYSPVQPYDLLLGDYQARLLKDPHKTKSALLFQEYELLLPDNTLWRCTVTGISE
ncbi:hypothetical protein [Granulicella mallensis]|uniref:Uncharacterized protein n=1 Tax=Granulicella mallensis (strain ATCC BAA-1857 / DSM 23137 / MP5ACTX8) TaxID=682795 RepID=G8NYZ2_GRAMM|nr:hypothetical protein [Granulicella mallensis]AEU35644.1 hypothetical protein AciX8_1301 [Granulicella mallensis MP5ACTX8]